jgi:hypothetical protein
MVPSKIALSQSELDSKVTTVFQLNHQLLRAGILDAVVEYFGPSSPMSFFVGWHTESIQTPWYSPDDATLREWIQVYLLGVRA